MVAFSSNEHNVQIAAVLMDFDANNIRPGAPFQQVDKHRVFFSIPDKSQAIKCFKDFNKIRALIPGSRHKLYYVRPEDVFVKYADIEAQLYYE